MATDADTEQASPNVIANARELAPEIRAAWQLFHSAWWELTSIDRVTIDLLRLKSAHLNDCKW